MKKEEVKKEALIALWNKSCKDSHGNVDFQFAGSDESPYYILVIDDGISETISATPNPGKEGSYTYNISVVFGEYVEYANFNLDKSEFDSLADMFTKAKNDVSKNEINEIVKKSENKFFEILKSCEV